MALTKTMSKTIRRDFAKYQVISGWNTTQDVARALEMHPVHVSVYINDGRFPNAVKFSKVWAIPDKDICNFTFKKGYRSKH